MSNYNHEDPLIRDAVTRAWSTHPYYATAIESLRIVADRSIPTMATSDKWVTHYNPDTLAGWTPAERAAVLVHELEHLLRQHSERCGTRDPQGWNVAADAEINQRLNGLPDGAIYPETIGMPRGQSAEVYYSASGQGNKGKPKPDDGSGEGQPGEGQSGPGAGQPKCGSSAGGGTQPHEAGDAANPGPGAADGGASARHDTATAVLGGNIPGGAAGDELREWAESELGIDRSSWYSALAAAVGHTMAPYGAPTRWRWPGRRDMRDVGGAMLPRWTGERPACAVVIDTSGSVSQFDLDMAIAAGHFIGRMADVTYYTCNTRAENIGTTLPAMLSGGGGTDLRVGIAMAIEEGARAVVVITDCGTPWPDEPTAVPVIIGANPKATEVMAIRTAAGTYPYCPPEWMTVLPIVAEG